MKRSLIAAIDLGTTGVRTVIVDISGNILGISSCETAMVQTVEGIATQSVNEYWQALIRTFRQAKEMAEARANEILVVGFSQQRCTFGLADKDGSPISDLIVWMDRRGLSYLSYVKESIGLNRYYSITGLPIYYISSLSKLLWFQEKAQSTFESAHRIWPIANFMLRRMGVLDPHIDHATASFYGLMDVSSRCWSVDLIDVLKLDINKLPTLIQPGTIIGEISENEVADQLGIFTGTPLVIGGGDQQCAALGNGMISPGQSVLNIGTGTAIMVATDRPIQDENCVIPCVCHAVPGQWEMEGHAQAAGIILKKFKEEFSDAEVCITRHLNQDVYNYLMDEASQSRPTSSGLLFIPTLNGSTAPVDYPYASGALLGLRPYHRRADILRAVLEGICLENRWILESIMSNGLEINSCFISGGASKSEFWNQLHADILGRPVVKMTSSNATSLGAAICAGMGVGIFPDSSNGVSALVKSAETNLPDQKIAEVYDHLYQVFVRVYTALRDASIFEDLETISAKSLKIPPP